MKYIILIILGFVSLWDGFTTFSGTASILGEDGNKIFVSALFAFLILGFLWSTAYIFEMNDSLGSILKLCWWVSIGYDLYTSYTGNLRFVMNGQANQEQLIILIGITILTSASPIICSHLLKQST